MTIKIVSYNIRYGLGKDFQKDLSHYTSYAL